MDPVSFAVGIAGLAGLFSTCLDVIDRVDSYKDFGVESRSIMAQFEADKHLFTKWAQDFGIDKDTDKLKNPYYLDNPETILIIQNILSSIQEIFSQTKSTVSSLHPVVEAGPTSFPESVHFLKENRRLPNPDGAISKRSRIGWSLRSKAKFISQVQQFGALVQRLYSLVPLDRLTGAGNMEKDTIGSDLSPSNDKATWFSNSQRLLIEMEKQIERETRKELNMWLGASWTNDMFDNLIQRRLVGTCDWILNRYAFLDWMSSDFPSGKAKILWINGAAGHGKSVLCARVVQYLSTTLESPLAYYFCSSESESRRHPSSIMRSWMSQVISSNRDAFELACGKWEAKDGHNASQTDIVELFKEVIQNIPNCTFVVDGLDECSWAEEKWKSNDDDALMSFFESIKEAVAHTTTRILILSRDEPDIRYCLRTVLAGDIDQSLKDYKICPDDIRSDALSFSRNIIDKKLSNKTETIKTELSQRIVDRCDGMFLWVKMLEEHLRSWKNKKQLEEAIDQAPTALDHIYDRSWMRISHLPDRDKLRAFSILRWAAFALRPMTVSEISEALLIVDDDSCEDLSVDELPDAVDEDYISSEILGPCGSLLETQKTAPTQDLGSMTIHLAHFSVRQYIICNMPAQGRMLMVNERLHASSEILQSNILAKLCLRYLNFRRVWQESLPSEGGPLKQAFRDYAARSWYHHYRECGSNYVDVVELTNAFFNPNNENWESWQTWFDANDGSKIPKSQRKITSTSPLFYSSLLGLRHTTMYLLEEAKLDVNHVDELKRTALQAAALKGEILIVKLLLENGADVTVVDNEGWTPLSWACYEGHVDVVKLLLENSADITVTNNEGRTPLIWASGNGHVDVVKLLLENGADVTVVDNEGWTPVNGASCEGHFDVVKLLLEKGADVTVANNKGWAPLHWASCKGHVDIIKLLLEKGASITAVDEGGWTPLSRASYKGHVDVVKLLLENGADVTVENNEGWTPVNGASYEGHFDVVKLLLDKGADITVANKYGRTALHMASHSGHVDIVKLLLENNTDVTVVDKEGWTPLTLASHRGHVDVVKLLLEKGTSITAVDEGGWTPLSWASYKGHVDIVKLLLENGADVTVVDNEGWTPVNRASYEGHFDVVKLLLEKGADVTVANNKGWAPLHRASNVDIVKLLLEKGADVTVANNKGWTPLSWASCKGRVDVVKLLLEKGAEVTVANNKGWTPLIWASESGHVEVIKLLLDKAADPGWNDTIGRTPLSYAAKNGHEMVVRTLVTDRRVDIDSKDHYGATPLSMAVRNCRKEVVQLLLDTGCVDLNSRDCFGRAPIWWARKTGNADITQLLLDYAEKRDISISESDPPKEIGVTPNDGTSQWCDVCTLSILKVDAYYKCGICNGEDFDICLECYKVGGRCLDVQHSLIQRNDKDESE